MLNRCHIEKFFRLSYLSFNILIFFQAVIKMEEDGLFYLTNLGKHPISVNNRDVASGQQTSLSSSCLIEVLACR